MEDCPTPTTPIAWYRSQRFIALSQASVVSILTWAGVCLVANDWSSWRITLASLIGNIALQLREWWKPEIIAPIAIANKNNNGGPGGN